MCGLFGFASVESSLHEDTIVRARAARDALMNRGPDQAGELIERGAYLGHRRLSILDLSDSGRQPMVARDAAVAITVNGEIYNYRVLRRELGEHRFVSKSDSEVVLQGYIAWGARGLVERLDGMYAAVICDFRLGRVFLFRDRFGIKPLYLSRTGARVIWASDLRAIETFLDSKDLVVDPSALYDFLTYRYVPSPKTIYRNVEKLEPAQLCEFDLATGHSHVSLYWELPAPARVAATSASAAKHVVQELEASVREQMMSDVPVGFFLSGGIDSSIIVTAAVAAGVRAKAFSIGFDATEHDETEFAKLVAQGLGISHEIRILSGADAVDLASWMKDMFREPFADTSALATFKLAQFAREQVTVALSGDGGDELFGGYVWYERYRRYSLLQRLFGALLPGSLSDRAFQRNPTTFAQKLGNRLQILAQAHPVALLQALVPGLSAGERHRYRGALEIPSGYDDLWALRKHYRPELGTLKCLQYIDLKTFMADGVLTKLDRTTMAVSLEARVPFLATKVVELAFQLPDGFHFQGGVLKAGLKSAFADRLPDAIVRRPKKGFGLPTHAWRKQIMGQHASFAEALLAREFGVTA